MCHSVTKQEDKYKNLPKVEQAKELEVLLARLQTQQGLFTKQFALRDAAVKMSYVRSHKVTIKSKEFSGREFITVFGGL